jgi:hypothetical protein
MWLGQVRWISIGIRSLDSDQQEWAKDQDSVQRSHGRVVNL